jgi:hypothetical protein
MGPLPTRLHPERKLPEAPLRHQTQRLPVPSPLMADRTMDQQRLSQSRGTLKLITFAQESPCSGRHWDFCDFMFCAGTTIGQPSQGLAAHHADDRRARFQALGGRARPDQCSLGNARAMGASRREWKRFNRDYKRLLNDKPAPSPNDEWLLYQTWVGDWPLQPAKDRQART